MPDQPAQRRFCWYSQSLPAQMPTTCPAICRILTIAKSCSHIVGRLAAGLALAAACAAAPASTQLTKEPAAVLISGRTTAIDLWPQIKFLADSTGRWEAHQVLPKLNEFETPKGPWANLGIRRDAVWLSVPIRFEEDAPTRWVVDIEHPLLNRIDLFVVTDGRIGSAIRLGNEIGVRDRPLASRTHAAEIVVDPARAYALLLRVETRGSMVIPISIMSPTTFHAREAGRILLQGMLAGVSLCLLVYSLAQWLSTRKLLFLAYAVSVGGVAFYALAFFGIGAQSLWPDSRWLSLNASILSVHISIAGAAIFVDRALLVRRWSRKTSYALQVTGALAMLMSLGISLGLVGYSTAQTSAAVLTPVPLFLSVPAAIARIRQGDVAARYVLIGWGIYAVGAMTSIGVVGGLIPANFWTLHAFQFTGLPEAILWMRVLGLHAESIKSIGKRMEAERDAMRQVADTDALTGLLNRRGLTQQLRKAIGSATHESMLAVYFLDLDGFKAVNDKLGHEAGDELLGLVSSRLSSVKRPGDCVARLGGDEFVVLAPELKGEGEAEQLGQRMLAAFRSPFVLAQGTCDVGLTVGYALAPLDGIDPSDVLRQADAAMYLGKRAGRNVVRRADPGTIHGRPVREGESKG